VDHCRDGSLLPVPTVLSIAARVAEALAYAHRQHVVHRDIKPANIMYEASSDTVKVTDFGIARITDSSKTKTGLVLGTPSFMSPEQIAGKKVDGRSDLYSLGVMLFQMLTGVLPFRGDSMAELMYKIANEEAPDIRIVRNEISEQLAQVVARALVKRSDLRYQDGDAFAADLRAVIAVIGGQAPAAEKPHTGPVMRADSDVPAVPEKTTVMKAGGPGYDSGQQPETAAGEEYVTTAAFSRPDDPGAPAAGDGKTDPDDTKTGHL
jgi:serine/threonine-protein kinase